MSFRTKDADFELEDVKSVEISCCGEESLVLNEAGGKIVEVASDIAWALVAGLGWTTKAERRFGEELLDSEYAVLSIDDTGMVIKE